MGYDLLAAVFFAMLVPAVLVGFVAYWFATARARVHTERTWEGYAQRHGLTFQPAEGEWPNRTSAVLQWTDDAGTSFRLEALGREARIRTRLTVHPKVALAGSLSVAPLHAVPEAPAPAGLDDAAFLATYRVIERPAGFAERVLTAEVRRGLLGFHLGDTVTLGYRRGNAILEWPGGEMNDARLDQARALAAGVADALRDAFHAAGRDVDGRVGFSSARLGPG